MVSVILPYSAASASTARLSQTSSTHYEQTLPQIPLVGEVIAGWRIISPLLVDLQYDGDCYMVSDALFTVYGSGNTIGGAKHDYIVSLTEFYDLVEEGAEEGDPFDKEQLAQLRFYLRKTA